MHLRVNAIAWLEKAPAAIERKATVHPKRGQRVAQVLDQMQYYSTIIVMPPLRRDEHSLQRECLY